ncbi:MAG: cytidylate kinase-like family protein [Chloroflexi bacterium]|nr:cytidylate kinase-like family protein [Chloroflexota bacterium]
MAVVTINGPVGSGSREIGIEVARRLDYDYVDRLILAEAAKRLGATVEVLAEREQRPLSRGDRIVRFLQTIMERSAGAGGGDPYFGPGLGVLLGQDYEEATSTPITSADQLVDDHYIEALREVIGDIAGAGNAVIIGRGGNLILRDHPDAFHVGIVATLEDRIRVIVAREGLSEEEAERYATDHEKAREAFLGRFFKAETNDPSTYHVTLNAHTLGQERAVDIITRCASGSGGA